MRIRFWGTRGSLPKPGPTTLRYGGNTSCVQVTLSDGSLLVLDAGSGIRALGLRLAAADAPRIDILLTHLHVDHIQGLMFFAPLFAPVAEIVLWGPREGAGLAERLARYLSPPLSPLHLRDLPGRVSFREVPEGEWEIGPARVQAAQARHPGVTLGYRIAEGDRSVCYIPDQELALGARAGARARSLATYDLARGATLLVHDCQYTDAEYAAHVGWGHSGLGDVLAFARLTEAERVLLFHHDPQHDDEQLDRLQVEARQRWAAAGGGPHEVLVAAELQRLELGRMAAERSAAALP
jgi:phosphoribosyl 1,2-cyclic phosphodiesterase